MIKDRIKTFRVLAGLTQKDLAQRLGVSPQTVCNWESGLGEPTITHFLVLIDMGASIDFILYGDGSPLSRVSA
jgi:transcriptional regulator with XRE-family HTH domain